MLTVCETGVDKCGSPNRYKRKDEWNESYGEKNRGPAYVSRFVTPRVSASNKDVQTLPAQEEEEYSWTSDSDKYRVAIMNHIWSCEGKDHKIFDCPHYIYGECGKQALGHRMLRKH